MDMARRMFLRLNRDPHWRRPASAQSFNPL
jgi:hypothetical protein